MVQRYVAARPQRLKIIPQVALMTNLGDAELGENLGPGRSYSIEATFVNAPSKHEGAKYAFAVRFRASDLLKNLCKCIFPTFEFKTSATWTSF